MLISGFVFYRFWLKTEDFEELMRKDKKIFVSVVRFSRILMFGIDCIKYIFFVL